MNKLPLYRIKVSEEDDLTGVNFVSLVDNPAMDVNFLAFSTVESFFKKSTVYKKMLFGPLIVANKPRYRRDEVRGEYNVVFEPSDIEIIQRQFRKLNNLMYIIFQHTTQKVDGIVTQQWIVQDPNNDLASHLGFKPNVGDWYGGVYIEDDYFFNTYVKGAKEDRVKGFSIELNSFLERLQFSKFSQEDDLYEMLFRKLIEGGDNNSIESILNNIYKKFNQ